MELQLGLALPNAPNDLDGTSEGDGIDLDLNMGIGGGHYGCGTERGLRQQQQNRHHHQLLWATEDEPDDRGDGELQRSGTGRTVPRTLPLLHGSNGDDDGDEDADTDSCSGYYQPNKASSVNSNYVKVTMEGIGIGRKVDLSIHHSFHALKETLLPMFGIYNEDSENYQLAYQDRVGQWVFAEDSSWRNFVRSTQRLKIVKISG